MSGDTKSMEHLGLGTLTAPLSKLGLNKAGLMDALKLGIGATAGITGTDLLLSRVLVKDGVPMIPSKWAPAAIAVGGIVGGALAKRFRLGDKIATGIVAGTVGVAISEIIKRFTAPAAAATNASAEAAEMSGYGAQAIAGFGSGRAFAGGLGGFAGLSGGRGGQVYGVGTPDMSANRMFSGATVAIEDTNRGPMAGATVEYEDASSLAGIFN